MAKSLDAKALAEKRNLYTEKQKIHEMIFLLGISNTPYFDFMVATGYSQRPSILSMDREPQKLTLEDIFFPPQLKQLTLNVENLMLQELQSFCMSSDFRSIMGQPVDIERLQMLIARRHFGRFLRKLVPLHIVGERALEEKEKKGRTASVLTVTPCQYSRVTRFLSIDKKEYDNYLKKKYQQDREIKFSLILKNIPHLQNLSSDDLWSYQYYFKDLVRNIGDPRTIIKEGANRNKCIIIKEGKIPG